MTDYPYSGMSDGQLAKAFVYISIKQADATGRRDARASSKLIKHLQAIKEILRARGPEARRVLVPLLSYRPDSSQLFRDQTAQVRLNAAKELLAVVPAEARAALEELAERGPSFQRGSAGMCLQFLDDGIFKPT